MNLKFKQRLLRLYPILVLLVLEACIDPLKVTLIATSPQLVVDGSITDEPGPYQIKLFHSTVDLEQTLRRPLFESGASVTIINDKDESEPLMETDKGSGIYKTTSVGFRGEIGRSYKLKVITSAGKRYETDYQKLNASGQLDSVFLSFTPQALSDGNSPELKNAFQILINARGDEGSNLFRWRWKSVFKGETFPKLNRDGKGTPDPLPCSGYVWNGSFRKVAECTCCICWSTRYSKASIISKNDHVLGHQYASVNIGEFIINSMLFYDHLYIEVEQLSISEEVYNFWKLAEDQEGAAGNIFQPNSIKIHGNVHSVSDPNEEVLGVFTVSSVARKVIIVDKSSVPYTLPPIDTITFDCPNGFPNSTTEKPSFW